MIHLRKRRQLTVTVVAGLLAVVACEAGPFDPDELPDPIQSFALDQGLNPIREYSVVLSLPASDFELFKLSWGEPLDCIAGCFFASAHAVSERGLVGWISDGVNRHSSGFFPSEALPSSRMSDPNIFDLLPPDNQRVRSALSAFVACQDTAPEAVLARIADDLVEFGSPFLVQVLIRNPTTLTSSAILGSIANLEGPPWAFVAAWAHRALFQLEDTGQVTPPEGDLDAMCGHLRE